MPYDAERHALDKLVYIHHLKALSLDATGWSPGWLEVSLLGVRLYDLLEDLPPDLIRRYLAYQESRRIEGEGAGEGEGISLLPQNHAQTP